MTDTTAVDLSVRIIARTSRALSAVEHLQRILDDLAAEGACTRLTVTSVTTVFDDPGADLGDVDVDPGAAQL